ncbi:MAG: thiol-disulfide oxidoreductase DCC family protein [Flavobacteriaceae bacterium]
MKGELLYQASYFWKVELPKNKMLIIFDGVCNLCNSSVLFVIKRDKRNVFLFVPLQSETGKQIVQQRGIDTSKTDSIILLEPNVAYYTKSTAALKIGKALGGGWKLLTILEWIPAVIRDFIYEIIAKNRYKWFGKRDKCMVPTTDLKAKFLD